MKELEKYPKVKEAFEKWYYINYGGGFSLSDVGFFYTFPFSMQWGVWVDFCDSKGLYLNLTPILSILNGELDDVCATMDVKDLERKYARKQEFFLSSKTRPEARQKAFKQSLTILNDKI